MRQEATGTDTVRPEAMGADSMGEGTTGAKAMEDDVTELEAPVGVGWSGRPRGSSG